MSSCTTSLFMGTYLPGDVLLASVALDDRSPAKIRPVVVISAGMNESICICPVSSKPPFDAPVFPLTIDDFATGGLDLFGESYVMISRVTTIRGSGVIGKKGRLTEESLAGIAAHLPCTPLPDRSQIRKKKSGHLDRRSKSGAFSQSR